MPIFTRGAYAHHSAVAPGEIRSQKPPRIVQLGLVEPAEEPAANVLEVRDTRLQDSAACRRR